MKTILACVLIVLAGCGSNPKSPSADLPMPTGRSGKTRSLELIENDADPAAKPRSQADSSLSTPAIVKKVLSN